ncbi:MAG: MAPEG family protein [Bdellovibrionales bacterium]
MEYPIIIILLASIQYLLFGLRTGVARTKFGIDAPRVSGNETWERYNRVHLNTLEQLIVFIPALLVFSYYISPKWALVPGIAFLVARQTYSYLYIKNPKGRGFPPTFFVNVILVIGSLVGVVISLLKQ